MHKEFAPEWYSEEALQTVKKGYLNENETVYGMYKRLACSSSKYYPEGLPNLSATEISGILYEIFCNGWLSPSSPVAANFGTDKGFPVSCFGQNIGNSVDSIFKGLHEGAMLTKNGGGLGVNLSNVVGPSKITVWAKGFDYTANTVSQGGVRRGAVAIYLKICHPYILSLLLSKDLLSGDHREKLDCNIAVIIDEAFMAKLHSKDEEAIELFNNVLELRMKTGSPYIMFEHHAQSADPDCYKANNLKTKHSQLCCLTGDTLVLTSKGSVPIKELCGKKVVIYDGYQWVQNQSFEHKGKTNELIHVVLASGTLKLTTNHRCYLADGSWVYAKYLNQQHRLQTMYGSTEILSTHYVKYLEPQDVYCTIVPTTSKFALADNRVLTGNSEIFLHSDEDTTYSCVLSSLNLDKYYEWAEWQYKGYTLPMLGIIFLDAVNEEFMQRALGVSGLDKAVRGAKKGRPLALGTMGLHSLFMQQGLSFESPEAFELNKDVHSFIQQEAIKATKLLAKELGEPEWCKGFGIRNTHLLAIAPTTTNSVLCNAGTPGIEPQISNYYVMAGAKGSFIRRNKYLAKLLDERYGDSADSIWQQVKLANGSVQELNELTEQEKAVFKTAYEIDQKAIIRQAADRQKYICQGQSLNLFFYGDADAQYIVDTHLLAEKLGLKSLYYVRSTSAMNTAILSDSKNIAVYSRPDCPYCQKAKKLLAELNMPYTEYFKSEGKVPEIWIDGEKLEDGYTSLNTLFKPQAIKADANLLPSCSSCEG